MHRYAHLAAPLYELTGKDVQWQFGPRQQEAFESLKSALTSSSMLILPDPTKPYVVVTDAMDTAVGGTLMQDHGKCCAPPKGAPQEPPTRGAERAGNSTKSLQMGSVYLKYIRFVELMNPINLIKL